MNKAELVQQLTGRFDGNRKQAAHALESVVNAITYAVAKGEKVAITGFGVFERNDRPARMARNPATGAKVRVKKTSVPKFRAGTDFKAYVSGAKKVPKETAAASRAAGKTATSRSTATKAAARSTTKSAPAKRSGASKVAASKSTATKSATKSATKTTSARTTAKRTPARSTATARKTTSRRTAKS